MPVHEQKALIPTNLKPWIDARRRFRLSHAHVQMARELGMNPKKLGKLANHKQEPWKLPLPEFIAALYAKRHSGKEKHPGTPSVGSGRGGDAEEESWELLGADVDGAQGKWRSVANLLDPASPSCSQRSTLFPMPRARSGVFV